MLEALDAFKMLIRLTTIKLPIHVLLFLFMAFKIASVGFVSSKPVAEGIQK